MIPALSQVCSLPSDFASDIAEYATSGLTHVEIWLTKLEQYLSQHSQEQAQQLLSENGVRAVAASTQGGLFQPANKGFDEAWQLFLARLALCHEFQIPTLVVAGDIHDELTQELVERVRDRLARIAESAAARQVEIAFEFQATATFPNNLETTLALVNDIGSQYLGVCLDSFHFFKGPSKLLDLQHVTGENVKHVQCSDLADVPRELALDADRILPGDGDYPLQEIVERLSQVVYSGAVSIEILNPRIWEVPPGQFASVGLSALRNLLPNVAE